jgi:hypothetical protein
VTTIKTKPYYNEAEVAAALELSIGGLRELVRERILGPDESGGFPPVAVFQASDLVVLRLVREVSRQE